MRLLEELKCRNVIRAAIGYLAVGWLLLQAGALIFGALDLPNSLVWGLLALLAIGFIPTLVFAWMYELTPEGLKRTSEVSAAESVSHLTGRKLDYLVIGVLAAIVGLHRAFEWLDRAYRQHDGGLANLATDPLLKSLHTDARYVAFRKKMGLAQ